MALVLLVPRGDTGKEAGALLELGELEHVTAVVSYVSSVGGAYRASFSPNIAANFYSENYARIIMYTAQARRVRTHSQPLRPCAALPQNTTGAIPAGQSANLYDIKETITADTGLRNAFLAVGFIFLTLLLSFRSLTLPFILIFVIESAIWINLSHPVFYRSTAGVYGLSVINTVQLGATIDYAILMTDGYIENRKTIGRREAVMQSLNENIISLLTSGLIPSLAGLCLQFASSMEIVKEPGCCCSGARSCPWRWC